MPTLLTADEVAKALTELPGWSGDTGQITRSVKASSFLAGIRLVNAVAEAAERADHHPDIDVRWCTVTFTLSTHSKGGVTGLDLALAQEIDRLSATA